MIETPGQKQDRAAKARAALARELLDQAGGDPELAARLLSEHYREMQRRSVANRRARRARQTAELARDLGLTTTEDDLLALARRQSAKR
jgi:uncharacterized protein YpuA (DUF1002 family)